jgi:hypothetical protein
LNLSLWVGHLKRIFQIFTIEMNLSLWVGHLKRIFQIFTIEINNTGTSRFGSAT